MSKLAAPVEKIQKANKPIPKDRAMKRIHKKAGDKKAPRYVMLPRVERVR